MNYKKLIVLIAILCLCSSVFAQIEDRAKAEFRGAWVDTWNNGALTVAQIQKTLLDLKQYGFNAVLVQVRRRGDAFYFPHSPNTEPRVTCIPANLDVLQTMITEAKPLGIEVHAWMPTFLVSTSTKPSSKAHVVNAHPEYLTQNRAGQQCLGEGYFLDPGHPGALQWNENVALDIVKHYNIDGIHFDYIRMPQQDVGYNPTAIARYNKEFGTTGKPAIDDPNFSAWRRRQITDWLRTMYTKIIKIKPQVKVTVATFAGRSDAYNARMQDWAAWMKEGIVDANLPMNYCRDTALFKTRTDDIMSHTYNRHSYIGVGAYLVSNAEGIKQFKYAREKNAPGVILYSYASNGNPSSVNNFVNMHKELFAIPVATPKMSWKTKYGYILGQVLDSNNEPVYNAEVTLLETKQTIKSDSRGYYSFLNLPAGEYHIICNDQKSSSKVAPISVQTEKVSEANFVME